jgi:hypothetical protein
MRNVRRFSRLFLRDEIVMHFFRKPDHSVQNGLAVAEEIGIRLRGFRRLRQLESRLGLRMAPF